MSRTPLWGFDGTLDFWTALKRGEVDGPEKKAVNLLRRVCDLERFTLYCQTGQLPVMGNVTKRTYLALKAGGALELDDGEPVAWWCFSIGPYAPDIPDTDHVVSVRTILEGEELAMFQTGDRHPGGYHFMKHKTARSPGVRDPFVESFLPRADARPDKMIGTEQLLDVEDIQGKGPKLEAVVHAGVFMGANEFVAVNFNDGIGQAQPLPPCVARGGQDMAIWLEYLANLDAVGLAPANSQKPEDELAALRQALAGEAHGAIDRGANIPENIPRVPELYADAQGGFDLREGQPAWAPDAAARGPLVRRAPVLPDGLGIDMHDGTILHIDENQARAVEQRCGFRISDEIEHMQDEGYSPELIEYYVNNILPNAQLGDPRDALMNAHAHGEPAMRLAV
jgi:hypothetical protein